MREAFCSDLAPHRLEALEAIGVEDADLNDARTMAETVYCLGYRPTTCDRAQVEAIAAIGCGTDPCPLAHPTGTWCFRGWDAAEDLAAAAGAADPRAREASTVAPPGVTAPTTSTGRNP